MDQFWQVCTISCIVWTGVDSYVPLAVWYGLVLTGMYPNLLRELVAEFTLTDNPANTTTSQLRSMCHVDDSVILGSWLQETDHKAIEDQVKIHPHHFL